MFDLTNEDREEVKNFIEFIDDTLFVGESYNIKTVANDFGFDIKEVDFLKDKSAYIYFNPKIKRQNYIYLNKNLKSSMKNFATAFCVGYFLLNYCHKLSLMQLVDLKNIGTISDKRAFEFASCILLPENKLKNSFEMQMKNCANKYQAIEMLTKKFNVTGSIIEKRLNDLQNQDDKTM